jgi:dihydroorotate dehydrogenase
VYRALYWLLLRHVPAEATHRVSFALLRAAVAVPGMRRVLRALFCFSAPELAVHALGLTFPSPVGLAAGFDKDAKGIAALQTLGFGFIEIGTVTAEGQAGNPKPRLFRLTQDHALLNRMGFNNDGARAAAARLVTRPAGVVGVNIGKTKRVEEADALSDYRCSTELLAPYADYLVVNVSSPNTPGLRNLQAIDKLRPLLVEVREACDRASPLRRVPLLVKIAPDLNDADVDAVADLALELSLDGIIATNTTISRDGLRTDAAKVTALGAGGISGRPVAARSLAVLQRIRARVGTALCIISVGGIETGDDAWARITAGATLVQGYTGLVYGGPAWAKRISQQLARNVRTAGFASIDQAIGSAAPPASNATTAQ